MADQLELIEALEGAANMMRGMLMDPAIPQGAKDALQDKINEIEELLDD